MKPLVVTVLLLLAACAVEPPVNETPDTRQAQFAQFNNQINAQRDAKQIGYADGQKKKWDFSKSLWPNDPYAPEFYTYTIMLGEKVDRGELAASEYMYLATKKDGEIHERMNADESRRIRDAAAVIQSMPPPVPRPVYQPIQPRITNCHTDSFGNTNCTTF